MVTVEENEGKSEALAEESLDPFRDKKDAGTGEMVAYAAGGITDDIGNVAFRNLATLLVIGFAFNPILASLLTAIRVLWDGIMDPVVANISDNFKSRWGRRRPFVLAGSLLMGIISWCTWSLMPESDRVRPNEPEVAPAYHSALLAKEFGRLLVAYDIPVTSVAFVNATKSANEDSDSLDPILAEAPLEMVNQSRSRLVFVESDGAEEDLRIEFTRLLPVGAEAGEGFRLNARLVTADGVLLAETATMETGLPPDSALERKTGFFERIFLRWLGKDSETGMQWTSGELSYSANLLTDRARERLLLTGARLTTVSLLAQHFGIPLAKLDTPTLTRSEEYDRSLWAGALARLQREDDYLEKLMRSAGLLESVDSGSAPLTPEAAATDWNIRHGATDDIDLLHQLWTDLDPREAAVRQTAQADTERKAGRKTLFTRISEGFTYVFSLGSEDRRLVWFIMLVFLGMATAQTLHGASYWALGIEIAPSYDGRTRAMAWRTVANTSFSVVATVFLPFTLLPLFSDFQEGNRVLATGALFFLLPLAVYSFLGTRERTVIIRDKKKKPSFWRSVKEIGKLGSFWRMAGLYFFLGKVIGTFNVFGTYLIVYYIFDGDLLLGTSYAAIAQAINIGAALLAIPLVVWMCKRFEKQNAFRVALAVLLVASVLKYFCYNPDIPELVFIIPVFYGLAMAALYQVLSTMMADVSDLDELRNGERREGMFGAVVSVFNKSTSTVGIILSGVLIVATGFEVDRGALQSPDVFHNMLLAFSILPAVAGLSGFLLLLKYPLTRARCDEIKEQLVVQREKTHRANHADSSEVSALGNS